MKIGRLGLTTQLVRMKALAEANTARIRAVAMSGEPGWQRCSQTESGTQSMTLALRSAQYWRALDCSNGSESDLN